MDEDAYNEKLIIALRGELGRVMYLLDQAQAQIVMNRREIADLRERLVRKDNERV